MMKTGRYILLVVLLAGFEGAVLGAQQRTACQSCVAGLSRVHKHLAESSSNSQAIAAQDQACSQLPLAQQGTCRAVFQASVPTLTDKLQNSFQACGDLGICNRTELVLSAAASGSNDLNCELCEYVMATIKEQLDDPQTEADLLAQAEDVFCGGLPPDVKAQCVQYVTQYSYVIFDWVHKEGPDQLCAKASFCPAAATFPKLPPRLAAGVSRMLEVQDDDQCNTCQLVVLEASSMLSDPNTQKEILDYVKQNCQDFQAFADQCITYIDLYGPLVINTAKNYLKPELCTQLGFCSSQNGNASVSAS